MCTNLSQTSKLCKYDTEAYINKKSNKWSNIEYCENINAVIKENYQVIKNYWLIEKN